MHRHAAQRSVSRAGAAHLVQVAGRAGGDVARAKDDLLGHAPAHEHVQVREQLPPRDARLVRLWQLHHHAQRHACAAPRARSATGRRASFYASAACTLCPAAPHKASQTLVSTLLNTGNAAAQVGNAAEACKAARLHAAPSQLSLVGRARRQSRRQQRRRKIRVCWTAGRPAVIPRGGGRRTARHDGRLVHRVRALGVQRHQRVAALVVRRQPAPVGRGQPGGADRVAACAAVVPLPL